MAPSVAGMRVLGLIPARGGSKGIPRKNVRKLAGRPLICYSFDSALGSRCLDRIIVSTDDPEIAGLARQAGIAVPFMRPADLASDNAAMLPVVQHAVRALKSLDGYEPDVVVLLQPTAALRQARHIDEAVTLLLDRGADSIVSVCPVPEAFNPYWVHIVSADGRLVHFIPDGMTRYTRRQDLPRVYWREGTIYAVRRDTLMLKNTLYGDVCLAYVLDTNDILHLDSPFDWLVAELVMERRARAGNCQDG